MRHADYVYCNRDDSRRVRVFRRVNGRWDYDVFYPDGDVVTYSAEVGDDFATKRDALAEANYNNGPLRSIAVGDTVTGAAWYAKQRKSRR